MTLIEYFDDTSVENIVGMLLCQPERVIFIGDSSKQMKNYIRIYKGIAQNRGFDVEIFYRWVGDNNLNDIVYVLSHFVSKYNDCVFDLTGGADLYLVAVGIVMERFPGQIRCNRFNIEKNLLSDIDVYETDTTSEPLDISVDEYINIYGSRIIRNEPGGHSTYDWDFGGDFPDDVEAIWNICKEHTKDWNIQIASLGIVNENFGFGDSLHMSFDIEMACRCNERFVCNVDILKSLAEAGLITELSITDKLSFTFKNEQVKRCLTVAGQALELVIANRLLWFVDENDPDRYVYSDVRVGVVIDLNGLMHENTKNRRKTINEIDIIAMKGGTPVFISCKNGDFNTDELYKLNTVAECFGGDSVKKVLITTDIDNFGEDKARHLRARMKELGISCIADVDRMSDEQLNRKLQHL